MNSQIVELIGRNWLVNELLQADLEVAIPLRDRGIDLIAFADLDTHVNSFIARPIQMKAASFSSFGVNKKYARFPDLIIAYVWYVKDPSKTVTYALTYQEAVEVADEMGWTKTISWEKGAYSTTNPGKKLLYLLEPYKMSPPKKWWKKIIDMP
ncbi:MAG TPA: hypothetical protein DEV81_22500 [Cyanobacteria bacterium UBA11049]|nr:hypothetical protein [Cyanobacteria bacterium UBA11049]